MALLNSSMVMVVISVKTEAVERKISDNCPIAEDLIEENEILI